MRGKSFGMEFKGSKNQVLYSHVALMPTGLHYNQFNINIRIVSSSISNLESLLFSLLCDYEPPSLSSAWSLWGILKGLESGFCSNGARMNCLAHIGSLPLC